MNRKIVPIALLLCAAPVVFAADGQAVLSHNRACQVTVPASWVVEGTVGLAHSPDKLISLVVSSPKSVASFDEFKKIAPTVYTNDKITKQSSTEFQMEGTSTTDKPNVYRAITTGGSNYCIVNVNYESGTVEDARKIAQTLKPVQ